MRTDSVNLSEEAKNSIANEIISLYGKDYLSERNYKSKSKGAQEAHEAIRPTDFSKSTISSDYDQSRVFFIIFRRKGYCEMSEAKKEKNSFSVRMPSSSLARSFNTTCAGPLSMS